MVSRFCARSALLLLGFTVGCGPEFQASFEPLTEAGAPAADNGDAPSNGGNESVRAGTSGSGPAGSASGGSSAGDSAAGGVSTNAGTGSSMAGLAGACARRCDAIAPWAQRSYALGERVTSICKAPYNGACAVDSQHEFECQPPTGVVGLGWCGVRQPGVGNGWHEAWRLSSACE